MVRYVQDLRKALGCEFTDRIRIGIGNASDEVRETIEEFGEHIRNETPRLTATTLEVLIAPSSGDV